MPKKAKTGFITPRMPKAIAAQARARQEAQVERNARRPKAYKRVYK